MLQSDIDLYPHYYHFNLEHLVEISIIQNSVESLLPTWVGLMGFIFVSKGNDSLIENVSEKTYGPAMWSL